MDALFYHTSTARYFYFFICESPLFFLRCCLQLLDPNIPPPDLYPTTIMDLQPNLSGRFADLFIFERDHPDAIEPSRHLVADSLDAVMVPFAFLEDIIERGIGLDEPTPPIAFVNAASMVAMWGNFGLPATDFHPIDTGADKDTAVASGLLLEFQLEVKILEGRIGHEVAVFLVRAAFTDQCAVLDIPFFTASNRPASEVFVIEKGSVALCIRLRQLLGLATSEKKS